MNGFCHEWISALSALRLTVFCPAVVRPDCAPERIKVTTKSWSGHRVSLVINVWYRKANALSFWFAEKNLLLESDWRHFCQLLTKASPAKFKVCLVWPFAWLHIYTLFEKWQYRDDCKKRVSSSSSSVAVDLSWRQVVVVAVVLVVTWAQVVVWAGSGSSASGGGACSQVVVVAVIVLVLVERAQTESQSSFSVVRGDPTLAPMVTTVVGCDSWVAFGAIVFVSVFVFVFVTVSRKGNSIQCALGPILTAVVLVTRGWWMDGWHFMDSFMLWPSVVGTSRFPLGEFVNSKNQVLLG